MRKIALLLAMFMAVSIILFAQSGVIKGKIVDEQGNPIPYASITIANTTTGVSSDENGEFSISAKINQMLVFSATGFQNKEVSASQNMRVTLARGSGVVEDEVVVVGYGSGRRLSSIVGT
ncbi:MAG TPA: carboxypeptidase-like regulatory domain-containing protein, partial [Niabella sp.]|nr:carboxypeptidase-like regulatory domain-containing protein [Niabella sp.]